MAQQGILFVMPQITVFDLLGNLAAGGSIGFYSASNHAVLKNIYQNAELTIAWENPIPLNSNGEPELINTLIYLSPDAPYYVEFRDSNNNVINSYDDYPAPTSPTPVIPDQNIQNFVANPSFAYVYNLPHTLPATPLAIAPGDWYFAKSNTSATDTAAFVPFSPGQTSVPGNPINEFVYTCSVPGTGETQKFNYLQFDNVETFSEASIVFDTWLRSPTNSTVELQIVQHFGEGGSPDVVTTIESYTLSATRANYNSIIDAVPTVSGKTIGPGSYIQIGISYPLNAVCTIGVGVSAIYEGSKLIDYQEVPSNVIATQSLQSQYPLISTDIQPQVNPADGSYELVVPMGSTNFVLEPRAGRESYWPLDEPPSYALLENGLPIYSADYYNLANFLFGTTQSTLPHGTGPEGFTCSLSTATVTVTNFSNGAVTAGSAGTSPLTYTQVSLGAADTKASFTLLFPAATAITPGQYCLFESPNTEYYLWFSLQNLTPDPGFAPALTDKTSIKVIMQGSETGAQLAALGMKQIQVAQVRLPDARGLFFRGRNAGATAVFPVLSKLTLTSTSDIASVNFVITGLNVDGEVTTETLAGPNNNTVTSVNDYSAITTIVPSATFGSEISGGNADNNAGIFPLQSGSISVPLILNGIWMRDPDYAQRTALYTGGAVADHVPSVQMDQFRSHSHTGPTFRNTGLADNLAGGTGSEGNPYSVGNTGVNQTNGINVYRSVIIYY